MNGIYLRILHTICDVYGSSMWKNYTCFCGLLIEKFSNLRKNRYLIDTWYCSTENMLYENDLLEK